MKPGDVVKVIGTPKEGILEVKVSQVSQSGNFFQGYNVKDPTMTVRWFRTEDLVKEDKGSASK